MLALARFEDVLALAAEKRDLQIKTALEADMRLVRMEDGKLEVAAKDDDEKTVLYLPLLNKGAAAVTPEVTLDFPKSPDVRPESQNATPIKGGDAARIGVTLVGVDDLSKKAEGVIVVRGGAEPIARELTITPPLDPLLPWPQFIVIAAAAAALLLAVGIREGARRKGLLSRPYYPAWLSRSR